MNRWVDPDPVTVPAELVEAVGNNGLSAQLLARRGYQTREAALGFLDPAFYQPTQALRMPGLQDALPILVNAIHKKVPILVWGDFDVDGQTATTLLASGIRQLGGSVRHYIPIRSMESHGVHPSRLQQLLSSNEGTKLLLTCDTGIAAHQGIEIARQLGLTVIITDHHELPDKLPPADAIVTPRLLPSNHPLATLPGVGVAYKLIEALFNEFNSPDGTQGFLDLVALGIVADVALLTADTRYLLQRGLQILRKSSRLGLQALAVEAEIKLEGLTSEHISFSLAPRLNALGRLGDANSIVEFFTTTDSTFARLKAIELEALNARRKLLTDQVYAGALAQVEREPRLAEYPALVLFHPAWPGGLIGIVASRLVEYFHKPVILIAAPPGEIGRGSARSIPGVHITEAIATQSHLLDGYGGHPMAAGLAIQPENIDKFREGFSQSIARQLAQFSVEDELGIDAWINFHELSPEMVDDIYRLAPFGSGNPAPILAFRRVHINNLRNIGRYKEHLLLKVMDENETQQEILWWQGNGFPLPDGKFDLAFTVQPSTYQGHPGIQIAWVGWRSVPDEQPIQVDTSPIQWIDLRGNQDKKKVIEVISTLPGRVVYCEGPNCPPINTLNRNALTPGSTLVLWTIPPGRTELLEIINHVNPSTIVLCDFDSSIDAPNAFMERLAGLTKYLISKKEGLANLSQLAAASAQTISTILTGLEWLENRGDISISNRGSDCWQISTGDKQPKPELSSLGKQITLFLSESASFRIYFRSVALSKVIELCTQAAKK